MDKLIKSFAAATTSVSDEERAITATINTGIVDRDGDVLLPQGCNLKDYLKNPVVCWNHNWDDLPIGKCVSITKTDTGIVAKTVFAPRPADLPESEIWLPDVLYSLYSADFMRGWSVGIYPDPSQLEVRLPTKKDVDLFGDSVRKVVSKWKMLEYSACPIGVNPEAVNKAITKAIISRQTAVKLFGELPEPPVEIHINQEVSQALETLDQAINPPREKRVLYFMPPVPKPAPNVNKIIKQVVDKLRGKVFPID